MDRHYFIADVFTDVPFGGNPLAVFLDGAGLDARQMQAIAREMNLSETTFVTPGSAEGHFRVRIFTPAHELPFAGHPTIGTAIVLASTGATGTRSEIVLEEAVGPVRVTLRDSGATLHRDGAPDEPACKIGRAEAAQALGLDSTAIAAPPWQAGYGVPYVFVPLIDVAAVAGSALRADRWEALEILPADPYVFAVTSRGERHMALHARMFAPAHGIVEDPATGSAAAALAGSIDSFATEKHPTKNGGGRGESIFRLTIAQGIEMGRPSRIETETRYHDGHVAGISVGGGAVIVGEGRLRHLP